MPKIMQTFNKKLFIVLLLNFDILYFSIDHVWICSMISDIAFIWEMRENTLRNMPRLLQLLAYIVRRGNHSLF